MLELALISQNGFWVKYSGPKQQQHPIAQISEWTGGRVISCFSIPSLSQHYGCLLPQKP